MDTAAYSHEIRRPDSRAIELISRYVRRLERQYNRTLRCLFDLRRDTRPAEKLQ